jgi:hypothetical protein
MKLIGLSSGRSGLSATSLGVFRHAADNLVSWNFSGIEELKIIRNSFLEVLEMSLCETLICTVP